MEDDGAPAPDGRVFVLVGGWPGSGKTTLARALARELALPLLAKDEIKEAMADALGRPTDVEASQRLGRAAVRVMLRVAGGCPGAVMDSTWFPEVRPLVVDLPGQLVEVRCTVPVDVARDRYSRRAATRHEGHLDLQRTEEELWGRPSLPLGVGPVVEVDTTADVDVPQLAADVLARLALRSPVMDGPGPMPDPPALRREDVDALVRWLDESAAWLREDVSAAARHGHPPQPQVEAGLRLYEDAALLLREAYDGR